MKIDVSFPKVSWDQAFHQDSFNEWAQKEALATVTDIQQNLNNGLDANGGAMKEYSASYKKYLASIGENADTTDLLRTGSLHRSMQVQFVPTGAEIVFMGSHPTAGVSNAALAQQLYQRGFDGWFELGKQNLETINKSFVEWLENEIKKIEINQGE